MDEISLDLIKTDEDKKWAISRIDLYHTGAIDSLNVYKIDLKMLQH